MGKDIAILESKPANGAVNSNLPAPPKLYLYATVKNEILERAARRFFKNEKHICSPIMLFRDCAVRGIFTASEKIIIRQAVLDMLKFSAILSEICEEFRSLQASLAEEFTKTPYLTPGNEVISQVINTDCDLNVKNSFMSFFDKRGHFHNCLGNDRRKVQLGGSYRRGLYLETLESLRQDEAVQVGPD